MALTPANMAEALWIGTEPGKNHANVGIGQGTTNQAGAHTDISQAQIVAGYTDASFFLNASGNPVFRIGAGAGTTSTNTVHPRSEDRELLSNGVDKAAWDGRTGKHVIKGRSRMIEFTDRRPWICFFQAHGSEGSPNTSDLFRVQTEGANGTTTGLKIVCRYTPPTASDETVVTLATGYDINDWVTWEAWIGGDTAADNGRLRIWLDGVLVLSVTGMGQILCYWKWGCYLQDSVAEGASAGTFGAVEMEKGSLQVWHTGYPNPTVPVFTGPDDGLGAGADTQPPTIPQDVAAIRGDTTATVVWHGSTDNVGVASYIVRRTGGGGGTAIATLGKTDDGPSTSLSSAAKTIVCTYTAAQTGTLVAGHTRLWTDTGTAANVKMVVYADTAGVPTTRLAVSDTLTVSNTTEDEIDFVFSGGNQIAVTDGDVLWIGVAWPDPGANSINWSRNATTGQTQQATSNAPSPFGTPSTALSGPIDAYVDVQYATDGTVTAGTPTSTILADTGLTNGVEYSYTVSAVDTSGNESGQSNPTTVTPGEPDVTPPTVPADLVATPGDQRVSLTWTASTDADTGIYYYRVYRYPDVPAQITLIDEVTTTSAVDTGVDTPLPNGTAVTYAVSAVDRSLNESALSDVVTATPAAPAIGGAPFLPDELGRGAALAVEVAFGADLADLTADPATWVWTDVTADVRVSPGISTSLGRNDESGTSNPAQLTLALDNPDGDYSLGGRSRHWPYIRRNTPVRMRIDPDDGGGGRVAFWGGADGWTPGWQDGPRGRVPVVVLSASGTLRRLAQGAAPVQSAYRRASTAASTVVAYWPMEEGIATGYRPIGGVAALYAPAVRGGDNMYPEDSYAEWGADSTFYCSAPLPRIKDSRMVADVFPYTDTGEVQVRFLMLMPESVTAVPAGAYILSVFTSGSIARWDVVYGLVGGSITVNAYTSSGALSATTTSNLGTLNGNPARVSLELEQVSGDISWRISGMPAALGSGSGFNFTGTITGQTVGAVTTLQFGANRQLGDTVIGHLTLENAISPIFATSDALVAFHGEVASSGNTNPFVSRLERLASENGVVVTRYTSSTATSTDRLDVGGFDSMGPQLVGPLLTLLREAEAADQGQLWDGRSYGLSYTTRRRREDGVVKLTIDAGAGELAGGFDPVDDDQRTRNKVSVKRTFGITSDWEDATGPLGTGTIGVYDESATVNLGRDQDAIQHAQWRVGLGTVENYRYPSVTVDLRAAPHLAAAVLDLIPGERIDVTNLDDTLAQFTAPSVSLIVEGIAHEITAKTWKVTFRCSPFEPWAVGRVADETGDTSDMVMRLDTDVSALAARAEKGATALNVSTAASDAPWTTNSDDYPLMLEVDGLPMQANGCTAYTAGGTGTLGKTSDGASTTASSADKVTASRAVAAVAGTLTAGHCRVWVTAGSTSVTMAVYSDVGGVIGERLATSAAVALSATAEAVVDFTFSAGNKIAIDTATAYWIALAWDDPGADSVTFSRDATANGRVELSITYPTLPNPWGPPTLFSGVIDAYLDVTQPAGQVFNVEPVAVPRPAGAQVQLWRPRRLGMGKSTPS